MQRVFERNRSLAAGVRFCGGCIAEQGSNQLLHVKQAGFNTAQQVTSWRIELAFISTERELCVKCCRPDRRFQIVGGNVREFGECHIRTFDGFFRSLAFRDVVVDAQNTEQTLPGVSKRKSAPLEAVLLSFEGVRFKL